MQTTIPITPKKLGKAVEVLVRAMSNIEEKLHQVCALAARMDSRTVFLLLHFAQ